MSKFFRARKAREIRAFLIASGFILQSNNGGDDDVYSKVGYQYTVKIPNRDNEVIPDGTMSSIRKCIRHCGLTDKEILNWWKDNKYGD